MTNFSEIRVTCVVTVARDKEDYIVWSVEEQGIKGNNMSLATMLSVLCAPNELVLGQTESISNVELAGTRQ